MVAMVADIFLAKNIASGTVRKLQIPYPNELQPTPAAQPESSVPQPEVPTPAAPVETQDAPAPVATAVPEPISAPIGGGGVGLPQPPNTSARDTTGTTNSADKMGPFGGGGGGPAKPGSFPVGVPEPASIANSVNQVGPLRTKIVKVVPSDQTNWSIEDNRLVESSPGKVVIAQTDSSETIYSTVDLASLKTSVLQTSRASIDHNVDIKSVPNGQKVYIGNDDRWARVSFQQKGTGCGADVDCSKDWFLVSSLIDNRVKNHWRSPEFDVFSATFAEHRDLLLLTGRPVPEPRGLILDFQDISAVIPPLSYPVGDVPANDIESYFISERALVSRVSKNAIAVWNTESLCKQSNPIEIELSNLKESADDDSFYSEYVSTPLEMDGEQHELRSTVTRTEKKTEKSFKGFVEVFPNRYARCWLSFLRRPKRSGCSMSSRLTRWSKPKFHSLIGKILPTAPQSLC